MLEGLLINLAKQHLADFNKSRFAPKDVKGSIKKFKDWSLSALVDVANDIGYIGLDVKNLVII